MGVGADFGMGPRSERQYTVDHISRGQEQQGNEKKHFVIPLPILKEELARSVVMFSQERLLAIKTN